jgi:hypothetical protein
MYKAVTRSAFSQAIPSPPIRWPFLYLYAVLPVLPRVQNCRNGVSTPMRKSRFRREFVFIYGASLGLLSIALDTLAT